MIERSLRNPPLVEAIFELRWRLEDEKEGFREDPYYSLLVGELYAELKREYPFHQQLESAQVPPSLLPPGVVQHRFRVSESDWPLVQLGPGVFTVNDTSQYTWDGFRTQAIAGTAALFKAYSGPTGLDVQTLMLRYINGIEFDYDSNDIFAFLRDTMHSGISIRPPLDQVASLENKPLEFDYRVTYKCREPQSMATQRFTRGTKDGKDALIWQTHVISRSEEIPELPDGLRPWLEKAHDTAEKWFLALVKGELLGRFE